MNLLSRKRLGTVIWVILSGFLGVMAQVGPVSVHLKNASLQELFSTIESQTQYRFAYRNVVISKSKTITLSKEKVGVKELLNEALANTGLAFTVISDKSIVISEKKSEGKGAVKKISGVVLDENNEPVIGANVSIKGTTTGTITDIDGRFSLDAPQGETLLISYVGYSPKEQPITTQSVYTVSLAQNMQKLDEVVVIGYGSMRKSDLTGSIANVNQESIKNMKVATIDQKLVGQIAGVQIQQVSGAPGAGSSIKIRGSGSVGAGNEPLYVVDGMPYSSGLGQNLNPLVYLSPNDIESVTVLKDASSTAIYGSRGANGVIMITTKKGEYNKTDVSVSSSFGVQTVPSKGRPKMMNASQFAELQRNKIGLMVLKMENRQATPADYPVEYLPENIKNNGTDWYDLILRDALTQDHSVSVNKGTKESRLNFSAGYFSQQGVLKYTGLERFSGKLTMESNISKTVTIGASLQPTFIVQDRTNTNNNREDVIGVSLWANPVLTPYDGNGKLIPYLRSPQSKYHNSWSFMNPLYVLQQTAQSQKNFQNLGIAYIEWEIIKGLKLKSSLNTNYGTSQYFQYVPTTIGGSNNPPNDKTTGRASVNRGSSFDWVIENTLTYDKTVKEVHRFNAMLGYTTQSSSLDNISLSADPYTNDLIQTINAAQAIKSWGQNIQKWSMISYLGRINYSFKDKYLVTATFRTDGSSRFGPNARYASFPSVALGWRASEEEFIKKIDQISNLKVRLSYGTGGNNNIGNYAHLASVNAGNYVFAGNQVTGSNFGIGNPDLTWEESNQIDAGVDLGLFKDRLSVTIDYYYRRSENMLLTDIIPAITGFKSTIVNKGNVRNTGVEISVGGTPVATKDFRWDANLNLSLNRNKVISLNESGTRILSGNNDGWPTHVTEVGKPVGQFFGFIFDGLYSKADLTDPNMPKYPQIYEGAVRYKDMNGDKQITDLLDYVPLGNPHPDFLFGLTSNLSYRDFDLSFVLNGQYGGSVVNGMRQSIDNLQGFFNVSQEWTQRWRSADSPGDGRHYGVPNITPSLGHRMSDLWLEDATYLRIANVTVGYSLPQSLLRQIKFIKQCRFYLSVQNLATFTGYSGGNPEGQSVNQGNTLCPGFDISSYPLARTASLGLNVTF